MTFIANGKYKLSLTINDLELSNQNSTFSELTMIENAITGVPVMELGLMLTSEFVEANILSDGSKVSVGLEITDSGQSINEPSISFRVFNYSLRHAGEYYTLSVTLIADVQDLLRSRYESFDMTSYNVMRTLASRNGLKFEGDQSTDRQIWIRHGTRGNAFLNDVCQKAWSSNSSCYVYNICRNGTLRFLDLSKRLSTAPSWTFVQNNGQFSPSNDPTQVLYGDIQYSSNSGTYNRFFGYGRSANNFNVDTGGFSSPTASSPTYSTKYLQINNELLRNQRSKRLAHNSGNTHSNYDNAIMQNLRYKSLYSVSVKALTEYPRDFQIFDRVTLQGKPLNTSESSETYIGNYFISAITTQIDAGSISRTAQLVREGVNPLDTANLRS